MRIVLYMRKSKGDDHGGGDRPNKTDCMCRRAAHHRPDLHRPPSLPYSTYAYVCTVSVLYCTVLYCIVIICICIPTRERCARVRVVMMSYNESVVANKRAVTSRRRQSQSCLWLIVLLCLQVQYSCNIEHSVNRRSSIL